MRTVDSLMPDLGNGSYSISPKNDVVRVVVLSRCQRSRQGGGGGTTHTFHEPKKELQGTELKKRLRLLYRSLFAMTQNDIIYFLISIINHSE